MRFVVDPWDPGYGTSVDADLGTSRSETVVDVEVSPEEWGPVPPQRGLRQPDTVLFVDGVRRVDAQIWVDEGDGSVTPGLCASYAAGVVCCCLDDGAHLTASTVRRSLVTAAKAAQKIITSAGDYAVVVAGTARPGAAPAQVLSAALQVDLARAEAEVAAKAHAASDQPDALLVLDGPLRGPHPLPRALGFVKTHHSSYLPLELGAVVGGLMAGERTPVFRIERPFPVYSCYLRLPGGSTAPWAGIARVECGGELSPAAAVALADLAQVTLVRYASVEYKDSRAPQNLYPIAGLERGLRRRLGEPALLYRALRASAT